MLEKVEALIYDVEDSFQTYVKYVSHGYKKNVPDGQIFWGFDILVQFCVCPLIQELEQI